MGPNYEFIPFSGPLADFALVTSLFVSAMMATHAHSTTNPRETNCNSSLKAVAVNLSPYKPPHFLLMDPIGNWPSSKEKGGRGAHLRHLASFQDGSLG